MPRTTSSSLASQVAGEAVREARLAVGVSQAELARRLGTTPPYISSVEAGRSNITVGRLWAVAEALGVEFSLALRPPPPGPPPPVPAPPDA